MKMTLSVVALSLAVTAASTQAGTYDWQPASIRHAAAVVRGVAPVAAAVLPATSGTAPSLSTDSLVSSVEAFGDRYSQLIAAAEMHACEFACEAAAARVAAQSTASRPPRLIPPEDERVGHIECSEMSAVAKVTPARREPLPLGPYLLTQLQTRLGIELSPASAEDRLLDLFNGARKTQTRLRRGALRILAGSEICYETNPFEVYLPASAPSPASLTAKSVQARALLDEYHAYDLTLNDRLWLSRTRSTVCEGRSESVGCTPVGGQSTHSLAAASESFGEYVRESESLCGVGSSIAVRPTPAFASARQPVCGYVIARLPVDHSLTSSPSGDQTAASFVDADPSVLFGPHVAPPLDLHLRGLAWVAQDTSNNWRNRRAAWAAAVAVPPQISGVAEAREAISSAPEQLEGTASVLRGLAAVTLERLSESLATASVYAGAASQALSGPADAQVAGRPVLKR